MEQFAVLLEEFGALTAEQLAALFVSVLGMVRYDAQRAARLAQGILAERLDAAHADALVQACANDGAVAHRVPQTAMATVGKPLISRKVTWDDDALYVTIGYTGAPRALPWHGVRLLSAAVLTERALGPAGVKLGRKKKKGMGFGRRMMLNSILPGLGSVMAASAARSAKRAERDEARKGTPQSKDIEVADAFATDANGELLHLRWRGPDLYYGEILGDARAGDPAIDFRQVLGAIIQRATAARVTPALQALVAPDSGVDPAEAQFEDEHAFGEYNRWQLQSLALDDGAGDA